MNHFFKTFFACLLAIVVGCIAFTILGFIVLAGIISTIGSMEQPNLQAVTPHTVLKLDLAVPVVDRATGNAMELFDYNNFTFREQTTLMDVVTLIDRATDDPRIDGIYLSVPMAIPTSITTLYEIRTALAEFREKSGKFVIAYADVYGQDGYYLASVADKVYANPQGGLDWRGLASNNIFVKGTLDKLGVKVDLIRHGSFKAAGEPLIREEMSEENRLQTQSLINSVWDFMVSEIAESREVAYDSLQQYASDLAVTTTRRAVELGMVDKVCYRDELSDELARLTTQTDEPKLVGLSDYKYAGTRRGSRGGVTIGNVMSDNKIAVIYAEGDIVDAGDKNKEIVGNQMAGLIRSIRKENQIKAIVFRVNSGGGSALASEAIWREIHLAAQDKPVIVSMGEYAASGGYYIACPADQIITSPMTITGSIGVFGLVLDIEQGAREKLGITTDVVRTNPSGDLGNMFRPLTGAERIFVQNSVDSVYARFTSLVAQGRNIPVDSVDVLGGGRVWTGTQAVENGLADMTGTLKDAIRQAAESAGLALDDYAVRSYPQAQHTSFASILGAMTTQVTARVMGKGIPGAVLSEMEQLEAVMKHQGAIRAALPYTLTLTY